jgi:pimeloyl-ACP methyl ester carboxylesterase
MNDYQVVSTDTLNVGYLEWLPKRDTPIDTVVLLHGWPDCPEGWAEVGRCFADAGYRVLAPALRGFGPTTFRSSERRGGQLAALGRDLLELIGTLQLHKPILIGHDWGARAAGNACGLQPGVASHLVMMSVGYGTNDPHQKLSLQQVCNYWYQWYMATVRGEHTVRNDREAFTRMMWDTWSPTGWYTESDFQQALKAFSNPDWADVVLHSYRHRWGFEPGTPCYQNDDSTLSPAPVLDIPTLVLHGEMDTCNHPDGSAQKDHFFSDRYQRELLPDVGHFLHREAPGLVAKTVLSFLRESPDLIDRPLKI